MESAKRERELLIAVLAAIRDPARAADLPAGDPLLLPVARHHRLTPLLSATCGKTLPPPLRDAPRQDRIFTVARNALLGQVAAEVVRSLGGAGVATIILKGLDYETRLYGAAGTRPTSDIDLLIPEAHRRTGFATLDRLGFEPRAAAPGFDDPDYHEVAWTRGGVEVDLHMALAPLARCRIDYQAIWQQAVPAQIAGAQTRALALPHAAIFQALHMAIDHFDVPAIYLLDLARLLPGAADLRPALEIASRWHCEAPLTTSTSLMRRFVTPFAPVAGVLPHWRAQWIIDRYGGRQPLARPSQLIRKVVHFDRVTDLARYTAVQSRRKVREVVERRVRGRSARERLAL